MSPQQKAAWNSLFFSVTQNVSCTFSIDFCQMSFHFNSWIICFPSNHTYNFFVEVSLERELKESEPVNSIAEPTELPSSDES